MRLIDAQTVEFDISFTEPTQNVDGTPLTDLAYSTVYITNAAGTLKAPVVAAVSVNGGKDVKTVVRVNAADGKVSSVSMSASSTDLSGNEGPKTAAVTKVIDRVGPTVPTGFTVG